MAIFKQFQYKDENGETIEFKIGALGENVQIDGKTLPDMLDTMVQYKGALDVGFFDTLTGDEDYGMWLIPSGFKSPEMPVECEFNEDALLFVIKAVGDAASCEQVLVYTKQNITVSRTYDGAEWSDWVQTVSASLDAKTGNKFTVFSNGLLTESEYSPADFLSSANKSVQTGNLADKSVTKPKIGDKAVGTQQLEDKSVGTLQLADKAVGAAQIGTKAITNDHLNDGAVRGYAIEDGTISYSKLASGSVIESKIAENAVASWHIKDRVVTPEKLDRSYMEIKSVSTDTDLNTVVEPGIYSVSAESAEDAASKHYPPAATGGYCDTGVMIVADKGAPEGCIQMFISGYNQGDIAIRTVNKNGSTENYAGQWDVISRRANITKHPQSEGGDIITTHLTVGGRDGEYAFGNRSFASGLNNAASDTNSAALGGQNNVADGLNTAVVGGSGNTAEGESSVVVGADNSSATAASAVFGGSGNSAAGVRSAAVGGSSNAANAEQSAVVGGSGNKTLAKASRSAVLGGQGNEAQSVNSVVIGGINNTAGDSVETDGENAAIVGGQSNSAYGNRSFVAGGKGGLAESLNSAVIGGSDCQASGINSISLGGNDSYTQGANAALIGGAHNTAFAFQLKSGHYAKDGNAGSSTTTTGDAFILGNGTSDTARSNCFRVDYAGNVYGLSAFKSSGAGVAELHEWADGNPDNEDRRGLFLTLDGDKIKIAEPEDDYIIGVIDPLPFVVGDAQSEVWRGMYKRDVFGEYETDEEGSMIIDPDYDPDQEYEPRENRSEFAAVSNWGKIVLIDDGTAEVNGYVKNGVGGKATKSGQRTLYRVMRRIDENHIYVKVGSGQIYY